MLTKSIIKRGLTALITCYGLIFINANAAKNEDFNPVSSFVGLNISANSLQLTDEKLSSPQEEWESTALQLEGGFLYYLQNSKILTGARIEIGGKDGPNEVSNLFSYKIGILGTLGYKMTQKANIYLLAGLTNFHANKSQSNLNDFNAFTFGIGVEHRFHPQISINIEATASIADTKQKTVMGDHTVSLSQTSLKAGIRFYPFE